MSYYYWCVTPSGKWLMATSDNWEVKKYNFAPNGMGDLIFRMSLYALITGDADVIKACIKLCNERKRWPDMLNNTRIAKNGVQYLFSKIMYRLKLSEYQLYRPQQSITRDSYKMLTCAIYWHQYEMIRDLKVPFWINRPSFYFWKKYLETSKQVFKDRYEYWASFSIDISVAFRFHAYVKHLNAWMAFIARSEMIKDLLVDHIPHWNLLCRMLCGDTLYQDDIDKYLSSRGYLWTADSLPNDPEILTPDEVAYIDRDILYFVYENQNFK